MWRNLVIAFLLLLLLALPAACSNELRFYLHSDPKTFNPALVADDSSETVRYLTGGVLIRLNRQTQRTEPELVTNWQVARNGKSITFQLRQGIRFSDGTLFTAEDVKYTMDTLMNPAVHSPTGDAFRSSPGTVDTSVLAPDRVRITFPAPIAGVAKLFDQVAIVSSRSSASNYAALGPFYVAEYRPGSHVYLRRNPCYWKRDEMGRQLPYLDAVRLEIQASRDIELLKFTRGDIQLINAMDADYFDKLSRTVPSELRDAGPGLDSELIWFNQAFAAPIASYKLEWFRSQNFRRAISSAINRADLCRVVYGGRAVPARGPVSPANQFWFNANLPAFVFDANRSRQLLQADGFRLTNSRLMDRGGHLVEFSIVTNAGNRSRERIAAMIQADLREIGITVNVVTLDFPSLIQRISETFDYEAALLGMTNVDLDPNSVMNVWVSSGDQHQWNPRQPSPGTSWEAEIDRLMRQQASNPDDATRKKCFDRVQQIAAEQVPFIYLLNKNMLMGIAPALHGVVPVVTRPQTYWNIERLKLATERTADAR